MAQFRSSRRGDGAAKQAQLLDAAGELIAELGIDRVTGKDITDRAGTSTNAINYYFGGIEGLYRVVLITAHRNLASVEELTAISDMDAAPEAKLHLFLTSAVASVMQLHGPAWSLRVASREFLFPTEVGRSLREVEFLPKRRAILNILAQVLDMDPDNPIVEFCSLSVLGPVVMLLFADQESRRIAFPSITDGQQGAEALVAHLHAFVLGGLKAVRTAEPRRA